LIIEADHEALAPALLTLNLKLEEAIAPEKADAAEDGEDGPQRRPDGLPGHSTACQGQQETKTGLGPPGLVRARPPARRRGPGRREWGRRARALGLAHACFLFVVQAPAATPPSP